MRKYQDLEPKELSELNQLCQKVNDWNIAHPPITGKHVSTHDDYYYADGQLAKLNRYRNYAATVDRLQAQEKKNHWVNWRTAIIVGLSTLALFVLLPFWAISHSLAVQAHEDAHNHKMWHPVNAVTYGSEISNDEYNFAESHFKVNGKTYTGLVDVGQNFDHYVPGDVLVVWANNSGQIMGYGDQGPNFGIPSLDVVLMVLSFLVPIGYAVVGSFLVAGVLEMIYEDQEKKLRLAKPPKVNLEKELKALTQEARDELLKEFKI